MKNFIRKHEYNFIKKKLTTYKSTLKYCSDQNIINVTKLLYNEEIRSLFTNLTEEETQIVNIELLDTVEKVDFFLNKLKDHITGLEPITNQEIKKLFKKEKKLRLPKQDSWDDDLVYLSWTDESTKKLYIVYRLDNQLIGMVCRLQSESTGSSRVCKFCNYPGDSSEVAFVSPVCKGNSASEYRSIGFTVCLDSQRCNDRMTSTKILESILKDVNNIHE